MRQWKPAATRGSLAAVSSLILGILVVVWAWLTKKPWSELGLARPRSWPLTIATGIVFGVAFKFCMKAIAMPLLGAEPINQSYHYLAGNPSALPAFVATILLSASFGEEVFYRGFLFDRSRKWFGTGRWATVLTVVFTALLFASGHYANMGWTGVEQAIFTGTVFGAIFARTRSLWMLMFTHAAFDLAALWMIYYGLETRIAHLIFK
jgi:membrane protease YdiL (CAAX protease family)